MNEDRKIVSTGVWSIILSVIGILTGCILVGILFDIGGIICGVVCVVSKKYATKPGVVGIVFGVIGLIVAGITYYLASSGALF